MTARPRLVEFCCVALFLCAALHPAVALDSCQSSASTVIGDVVNGTVRAVAAASDAGWVAAVSTSPNNGRLQVSLYDLPLGFPGHMSGVITNGVEVAWDAASLTLVNASSRHWLVPVSGEELALVQAFPPFVAAVNKSHGVRLVHDLASGRATDASVSGGTLAVTLLESGAVLSVATTTRHVNGSWSAAVTVNVPASVPDDIAVFACTVSLSAADNGLAMWATVVSAGASSSAWWAPQGSAAWAPLPLHVPAEALDKLSACGAARLSPGGAASLIVASAERGGVWFAWPNSSAPMVPSYAGLTDLFADIEGGAGSLLAGLSGIATVPVRNGRIDGVFVALPETSQLLWASPVSNAPTLAQRIAGHAARVSALAAVGDLDGDGTDDLVVATLSALRWVSVRLTGIMWGTKQMVASSGLNRVEALDAGDINGDGFPDLVGGTKNSPQRLVWYENVGGGSLWTAHTMAVSPAVGWIAGVLVLDVRGDGVVDVICLEQSSEVTWWHNTDNGTTWDARPLGFTGATHMTRGDVHGDGWNDVLVTLGGGQLALLTNNRTVAGGTLTVSTSSTCASPIYVQLARINTDDHPDAVLACQTAQDIQWMAGDGTGHFGAPAVLYSVNSDIFVTGDFDGDGVDDLVYRSGSIVSTRLYFLEISNGVAGTASELTLRQVWPHMLLAADFGTGHLDLLLNWELAQSAVRFVNDGHGSWMSTGVDVVSWYREDPDEDVYSVAVLDANQDGRLDVAMGGVAKISWTPALAAPLQGKLLWEEAPAVANRPYGGITHAKFNTPGNLTSLVLTRKTHPSSIHVVPIGPDGYREDTIVVSDNSACEPVLVKPVDADADGAMDLVALCQISGGSVRVYLNNGTGSFHASPVVLDSGLIGHGVASGPLKATSSGPDIVVAFPGADLVRWYANTGSGTFAAGVPLPGVQALAYAVAIADITGNGLANDIVVSANGGVSFYANTDAMGTFASAAIVSSEQGSFNGMNLATGDLNGDGLVDVVFSSKAAEDLRYVFNTGGSFAGTPLKGWVMQKEIKSPVLLDADRDGDLDLFYCAQSSNSIVAQWNQDGMGTLSPPTSLLDVGSTVYASTFGDLNGDGVPDGAVVAGAGVFVMLGMSTLHPLSRPTSPVSCSTVACLEMAIRASGACEETTVQLAPGTITTCFGEAHHPLRSKSVVVRAQLPGTVTIDCGDTHSALFSVTAGASLSFEGINFAGSRANALSLQPAQGMFVVDGQGASLRITDATVSDVHGGFVSVRDGGSAVLTRVHVQDCLLGAAPRPSDLPDSEQQLQGGAVLRVAGAHSSVLAVALSVHRSGPASDLGGAVGGAVLVEAGAQMRVSLHDANMTDLEEAWIGGAIAVVAPDSHAASLASVLLQGGVFADTRAAWGGAIAVLRDPAVFGSPATMAEVSASALVLPHALDPTAATVLQLEGIVLRQTHAAYGGALLLCDAGATGSTAAVSGVVAANSPADFGWACHGTGLADSYAAPDQHPWVGGALALAGGWATNWCEMAWEVSPPTSMMTGTTPSPIPELQILDAFGQPVVDASLRLRATMAVTDGGDASVVRITSGATVGVPVDTTLSLFMGSSPAVREPSGLAQTIALSVEPETTAMTAAALPRLAVATSTVALEPCAVGFGVSEDALSQGASDPAYVCELCGSSLASDTVSLDPCTAVLQCADPAVKISDTLCLTCPDNTLFNPSLLAAAQANGSVPSHPTAAEASVACVCVPGYWNPEGRDPTTPCVACPLGGRCPGPTPPEADAGFFDTGRPGAPSFAECPREASCVGGRLGESCATGSEGYMCATCSPGWQPTEVGCEACTGASLPLLLLVLVALFGAIALAIGSVWWGRRQGHKCNSVSSSSDQFDPANDRHRHPPSMIPRALSAALLFVQVFSLIGTSRFEWPRSVRDSMGATSALSLDLARFATSCDLGDFYGAYVVHALLPFVLFAAAWAMAAIAGAAGLGWRAVPGLVERAVLMVGPVTYIPFSKAILAFLDCTQLPNGAWYLDADLSQQCGGTRWLSLLPLALVVTILFVCGLPLYLALLLWSHRHRLYERPVLTRMGSLYTLYRQDAWFTVLLMLLKRLALVLVALFLSRLVMWLFVLMLVIFATHAGLVLHAKPAFAPVHNALEVRLNVLLSCLLVLGFAFFADRFPNRASEIICEIAVFAVVSVAVVFLTHAAIVELRTARSTGIHPARVYATQRVKLTLHEFLRNPDAVANATRLLDIPEAQHQPTDSLSFFEGHKDEAALPMATLDGPVPFADITTSSSSDSTTSST